MKKLLTFLYIFLIFLTVGCTSENIANNLSEGEEKKEITIITSVKDFYKLQPVLANYVMNFEAQKGVRVRVEEVSYNSYDDYTKKLNTNLYMKQGPTLVFFSNYNKVYDSLKYKGCFVPFSMNYIATTLNKDILDELGIKAPSIDWTKEEYLKIKGKWLSHEDIRRFSYIEYRDIVERPLYDLELIDTEIKKVYLNNDEIKSLINNARERIFSGIYIINSEYNYENYYNMFFDSKSSEYREGIEYDFKNKGKVLEPRFGEYALKTFITSPKIEEDNKIILPRIDNDRALTVSGFIINRNGVNIELGIEFLNGLLSDEVQLSMFDGRTYGGYPVNKTIKSKISEIEKENGINEADIVLRKYIIKNIEDEVYKPFRQMNSDLKEFYLMLQKDLMMIIFSNEEYTDEELSRELQKLENKYTMWLRE